MADFAIPDFLHEHLNKLRAEAYAAGQVEMRERAAEVAKITATDNRRHTGHGVHTAISEAIRALPTTSVSESVGGLTPDQEELKRLQKVEADYRELAGHHNEKCTCMEIY